MKTLQDYYTNERLIANLLDILQVYLESPEADNANDRKEKSFLIITLIKSIENGTFEKN